MFGGLGIGAKGLGFSQQLLLVGNSCLIVGYGNIVYYSYWFTVLG